MMNNLTGGGKNFNGLPIHLDLSGLTTKYIDTGNTFILPLICLINIVSSTICLIVLKNLKTGINQYLMLFSISDFIFAIICLTIGFIRCGSFCTFSHSFISKCIELYIYIPISCACLLFSLLVDLDVTIKKLKSFSIKHQNKANNFLIDENKIRISIFILVSLLVNIIIYPMTRKVNELGYLLTNNNTITLMYQISNNSIGNIRSIQIFVYILSIFRGLLLIIILAIINLIVLIKYRRYMFNRTKSFTQNSNNMFCS